MNKLKLSLILLLFTTISSYAKIKYLKVDLINVVLVSENGILKNDSEQRALMSNYIMNSLATNDSNKLDTMVRFIIANKHFFLGLKKNDIISIIGHWANISENDLTFKWGRFEMDEPTEKVILFFRFWKGKMVYMEAPYSAYCCVVVPDRPKWLLWYYMRHDKATYGIGRHGL